MAPTALITGITGQDGSYLAEFLIGKGYEVHGLRRRVSQPHVERLDEASLIDRDQLSGAILHYGDMSDTSSIARVIAEVRPDEIYNLAAQSHVRVSFEAVEFTHDVNASGPVRIFESLKALNMVDRVKFYQASSSEMYGNSSGFPQNEETPFAPRSPYAIAKVSAHWSTANFREGYGLHASCGILFNHESPRRSPTFVTRKISTAVARYAVGEGAILRLGNLDARRDWGFAPEYVEAMWLMLQQDTPGDYVIGTGQTQSVRTFVEQAFRKIGRTVTWRSEGVDEEGIDDSTGEVLVSIDPWYFRPTEVNRLMADPRRAKQKLNWTPRTFSADLVDLLVEADIRNLSRD